MSGPKFFETEMGKRFYLGTAPRLVKAMEKIAEELETMNKQKAKEFDKATKENQR